uniref:GLTSCR1 domain-containing protein n=1 Tax=Haemonchus contortus TaxID=6289 RepID=A0A7I4YR81_HAECO
MSFQEEDEWLGLGSGFVLDDAFKCTSPLGADTSLQVPLREPSPIAVSPQNLMDFSFGDNSLAVPMREFGFQSGNDPPRLSPVSSSYQSMAPLQNMSYEMSSASVMQEESYNSFEQPSLVVNGHYQTMEQQVIQPQQGYFQTVSDAPPQQVMTTSTSHQQQTSSGGVSNASGSLVQQILSAPSTRQTPTPQHNRQRPIQPKTQNNGRKRGSVNSHSGSNKSTKVDSSSNNSNQTEVRFSMSALTRITEIGAEMAQLQEQQEKLGINNSQRLSELQAQRASILYEALSSQNVGETVLSQVKQVAAAAAATPQPRSTPRSRASHANRQTHFESGQDSPQYQPQMYVASHNQYPSTSTAQFQEYSTGNANQAQVVHQQEQLGGRHQNQQRTFRTQNATTTVYHAPAQLPPGTVYVQNVPQAAQAQFTSAQPTVGEVVRQQHQLRHVSGAQQVIVQQVGAAPQVVVATGGQSVAGAQIRSQIVQQSPLPAQIVLAPPVQQSPQVVVVAQRASPAQAAKRLEEKRASRLSRLRNYFDSLHATLANPDTETPFTDLRDVMQRLLPYHAYGEPNFSEEHLEQFDTNYMRTNINLHEQRKRLEKRLRKVFYDEALNGTEAEERNLLLFLDGEYTKRKLEEEKEFVKQGNIEAFVRDSAIIAALRGTDYEAVEKPKPATPSMKPSSSKSIMQQYEYHTFDETPRVVSPYKSPSPFKSPASSIRSPSPCKSPSSIAYSPRVRARNSSQSIHMSPAPVQEQARARTYSKSRTISESSRSDKSEVRKTPLPPPLPCATTRRSTPLRRAVDKDSSKSSPMAPSSVTSAPGTPASVTSGPMTPAPATTASTMLLPKVPSPVESAPEVPVPEAVSKRPGPAAPVGHAHTKPASSLPVKSATSRGSEREKEVLDSPTAVTTLGRLPAKKELLCRARQGVPAEMRSPPAHTSIATSLLYNRNSLEDEDSEGSASPELGIDDVIPLPSSQQPQSPVLKINAHPTQSKPVPVPPPPPRLPPQKCVVPLPPPLPQRKEKLVVPPERTSSPLVKQENVKPSGKSSVEDRPAERFRFKPQVPRPTPVSPLKPTVSKREPPADSGLMGKDVNCINHHAEEKVQMSNCVKPPPIRLKLKLSGKEVYIENNENSVKEGEKKHRKHKKKKKERHKEHIGSVKHLKEKLRSKGHRKLQGKKEKHEASPQELVAVTSNGVRMKLKFGVGANSAGPSASARTSLSSSESKEAQLKQKVVESKPSTSKASAPNEAVRIPRLKIRIGPEAPALVIAPPDVKSASSSRAVQSPSTPSIGKAARRSKSPPVLTAATVPSDTLAVEFSDDSDTEAERLRCATDKALRGMSNLPGMARSNTSVLPWSTQEAP